MIAHVLFEPESIQRCCEIFTGGHDIHVLLYGQIYVLPGVKLRVPTSGK